MSLSKGKVVKMKNKGSDIAPQSEKKSDKGRAITSYHLGWAKASCEEGRRMFNSKTSSSPQGKVLEAKWR